ncbi:MAG TPA: hypothetical protein PLR59_05950 [Brevundimonas sp.]|nr:hypothetical protein [Brevundimonas sp.]
MRFRYWFIFGGSAIVLTALLLTDPDQGLTTGLLLLALVTPLLAVGFAHYARKALHDYPEADARRLFARAGEHPTGAGLALIALAIVLYGLLGLFGHVARADVRTHIPVVAETHRATLAAEVAAHWADHPRPAVLPALVEHESCITLKHSRCWNPASRLKSTREEGAGLGQITRAWHADGRLRFDALAEMRDRHPALREWSWANVYERADLQLRAVVLKSRDNYQALRPVVDPDQRLAFADAAYNGGLGGVQRERRACGLKAACDPQQWWGHVEHVCLKSRAPLYGNRSACDINRHHVHDVIRTRAPKYEGWLS